MKPVTRYYLALTACLFGIGATTTEAIAAENQCMTHAEAQALMETALPGLLHGANMQCSSVLGEQAYMVKQEAVLSERFRRESAPDWPKAKLALDRLAGNAVADMGDAGKRTAIESMVAETVSQKMKPQSCGLINSLLPSIADQSANRISDISVLAFTLVKKVGKVGPILPFDICSGD
ncbi:MAG: hypothetical protein ABF461_02385 [Zymomonas mobilis subsp. pomaceae]|uniref:hypothetical protein n=1 Tax=Zymomonas mobilis TaxID=542 RepID=UPI0039E89184